MRRYQRRERNLTPSPDTGGVKFGKPSRLSLMPAKQYQAMLAYVRAGAFREQAAKSLGVLPITLHSWLCKGQADLEEGNEETCFAVLVRDLAKAEGEARIVAEIKVKEMSPLNWLRYAGRSRVHEPGWTDDSKHITHEVVGDANHPVLIQQTSESKSTAMIEAMSVLLQLGLDPSKLVQPRPSSVFLSPPDTIDADSLPHSPDDSDLGEVDDLPDD